MDRNTMLKWLALAIMTVFSIVIVTPFKDKIRLGLDLSGGTSFTVQIDEDKLKEQRRLDQPDDTPAQIEQYVKDVLKDADARTLEVLRNRIDGLGLNEPVITGGQNHRIQIQLPGVDDEQRVAAENSIKSAAFLTFRLVHRDNSKLVGDIFAKGLAPEGYAIADGNTYRRVEDYKKVSADPEYAFRLARFQQQSVNYTFMLEEVRRRDSSETLYRPYFVQNKNLLTGSALHRANVETDSMTGEVRVGLKFKTAGAQEFAKITAEYAPRGTKNAKSDVGRQLAIVLDDKLYSAPAINEPIPSGSASISGAFSYKEGVELCNILNAGALPAPIKIIETRAVSPTLGKDAIASGIQASIIGVVLVLVFMLIYYTYCGLVANIALCLNMILWPLGMVLAAGIMGVFVRDTGSSGGSLIQLPVLTLPGIAGFVLTIGMAVDANVLIFERMREEFRLGKSARVAVNAGYDRAFLAIFDSNITTLLTACVLFAFGSGPIRGYAISLAGGLIMSMFTALVVTRLIFNAFTPEARTKPYAMMQWFKFNKVPFITYGKYAGYASLVIIVITLGIFTARAVKSPASVMAVDFTGGIAVNFTYDKNARADEEAVRKAALSTGISDATIQYQTSLDISTPGLLQIKTSDVKIGDQDVSEVLLKALNEQIPESKFVRESQDVVGSQIGKDLKRDVMISVLLSLVIMIVYISIRFEFGFGLGAIVALTHDVLITFGIYSLTGSQLSLTVVAALLTIIGYSINDTIVIFDRIREMMKKDLNVRFADLCNTAINDTMSRTVLTTVLTLLTVTSLLIFGGGAIQDFALTLFIGMLAGTYSTIFIATPVMLWWYKGKRPAIGSTKKH